MHLSRDYSMYQESNPYEEKIDNAEIPSHLNRLFSEGKREWIINTRENNIRMIAQKMLDLPLRLIMGWYELSSKLASRLNLLLIEQQYEEEESETTQAPTSLMYSHLVNNNELTNKLICSLPLIGSYPTEVSEKNLLSNIEQWRNIKLFPPTLLKDGFLDEMFYQHEDQNIIVSMINLKNEYKICSIARAVLTAAITVSIVALTVFALGAPSAITTVTTYATTAATIAVTAQQLFNIYKNTKTTNNIKAHINQNRVTSLYGYEIK